MPDPRVTYPQPQGYGVLEPGLQAAIDLLEREIRNESSASDLADAQDDIAEAMTRAQNVHAYRVALDLLREQMVRLQGDLAKGEIQKWWAGHPGEEG